jgi:hypothetical protein
VPDGFMRVSVFVSEFLYYGQVLILSSVDPVFPGGFRQGAEIFRPTNVDDYAAG